MQIWADILSSDRSWTETCCFAQDSTRNMRFCSYIIFLLRDQWLTERLSKAMGAALVSYKFLLTKAVSTTSRQFHQNFHFTWKKNDLQSRREALANPNGPKEARAWPLILPSKPSITFWNSLWRDRQMTSRDSTLDSNLNSAAAVQPDQRLVKVLSPLKSQQRQCGVSILFKSITDAKSEPREVRFLMLMPQSGAECEALAERY